MRVQLTDRIGAERFSVGREKRIRVRYRLAPAPDRKWLKAFDSPGLYSRFHRPSPGDFKIKKDICEFECGENEELRWLDVLSEMVRQANRGAPGS